MFRVLAAAGLAAALALAGPAAAQGPAKPIGIPIARGVPGGPEAGRPPDWLTPRPPGGIDGRKLDDPRWQGCVQLTHGHGANPTLADFRAVYKTEGGATFLYLSWAFRRDPQFSPGADRLYVGFAHPDGNATFPATVVSVILNSAGASASVTARDVTVYAGTEAAVQPDGKFPPVPAATPVVWARDNTAVWVEPDPAVVPADPADPRPTRWAVNMKVPVVNDPAAAAAGTFPVAGIPAGGNSFKMWYQFLNVLPADTPNGLPPFEAHSTPDGVKLTNKFDSNTVVYPAVDKYAPCRLRVGGEPAGTFREDGLSLKRTDVKTKNVDAAGNPAPHLIKVPTGGATQVDNEFVAKVANGPGAAAVDPNKIKARFRVANWGSTFGQAAGLPGGGFEDLWTPLTPAAGKPNGENPTAIPAGSSGDLPMTWTAKVGDPLVDKFLAGTRSPHQCILVELESTDPALFFVNSSVFTNMDLATASTFSRKARVSVAGLPALDGEPTRKVYLYVRAANLPPAPGAAGPGAWPVPPPKVDGPKSDYAVPVPKRPDPAPDPDRPKPNPGPKLAPTGLAAGNPDGPAKPPPGPADPTDPTADPRPTYTVYAWHETGKTLTLDGLKMREVEAQTSFGYYVNHDGPLTGWRHALTGAEKIGPNFYVVRPPVGGFVDVGTEIEAVEPPVPLCCCGGPVIVVPRHAPPARRGLLFRRWRN